MEWKPTLQGTYGPNMNAFWWVVGEIYSTRVAWSNSTNGTEVRMNERTYEQKDENYIAQGINAGGLMSLRRTKSAIISWAGSNRFHFSDMHQGMSAMGPSKVNMKPFGHHIVCMWPIVFELQWMSEKEFYLLNDSDLDLKIWSLLKWVTKAKWAMSLENLFLPYANNKGADQPAHPHSLISAFVICCLESIISVVSMCKISSL